MANPKGINTELIQKVLIADSTGNVIDPATNIDLSGLAKETTQLSTNQNTEIIAQRIETAGTLFGDDAITAQRISQLSGRWSQGIPADGFDITCINSAYWQNVVHGNGSLDGAIECMTGTDANGFFFGTSKKLNRYQDGIQSYFTGTFSFENLANANGDFEILDGAMIRGLASDNKFNEIKEGQVFGYIRNNGHVKRVFRAYKNFEYTEVEIPDSVYFPKDYVLTIFTISVGYLGIHPFILEAVNTETLRTERVFTYAFEQNTTSINDPNLAFGVFIKNNGNTANIGIRNGSINFGNIGIDRDGFDSSARRVGFSVSIPSLSTGDGSNVIATFTILEKAQMVRRIDSAGVTYADFVITQTNKLLSIQVSGLSNKPASLEIWLVPKSLVTGATYTPLKAYFNVIARATGAAVGNADTVYTQGQRIKSFIFNAGGSPLRIDADLRNENFLLTTGLVGVLVVRQTQTVTDLEIIGETEDLF